jgi:hypothetical protein
LSFNSRKFVSQDLEVYFTARKFWENLGIPYNELPKLSAYEYDVLKGIMNIESQYSEREANTTQRGGKHLNKHIGKR